MPTLLVVVLSWLSFWIDETAVPARVSLGILNVLTMTSQATAVNQQLPRVSYIKAIDVWMTMCLVFVFGALLEFSVVNMLRRRESARENSGPGTKDLIDFNQVIIIIMIIVVIIFIIVIILVIIIRVIIITIITIIVVIFIIFVTTIIIIITNHYYYQ